jgi:hypothetical protein
MLSRVRKADAPAPLAKEKQPDPPAPTPEPAAAALPPATAPEEAPEEVQSNDIGSILDEIVRDEELITRILGVLYRAKKKSPNGGAVAIMPMEKELGIPRESATFVLNYMKTKHFIEADDKSRNMITVDGIDFLRTRLSKS